MPKVKRVKIKQKNCPNPLFEKWLLEWKNEATEKGSEMRHCFGKALKSLKRYPLTLNSGQECFLLDNFGAKLCQMLDKKLEEHKQNNSVETGESIVVNGHSQKKRSKVSVNKKMENTKLKANDQSKTYVPTWRSGGYAILLTLFEKYNTDVLCMSKSDLSTAAQPLCDSSFTKPLPGSHYTAWSSMSTLLKKNLVTKFGNPPRYKLTESGTDLAIKLIETVDKPRDNVQKTISSGSELTEDILCSTSSRPTKRVPNITDNKLMDLDYDSREPQPGSSSSIKRVPDLLGGEDLISSPQEEITSSQQVETCFLLPGSFDVILLVDNNETEGKKTKLLNDATVRELTARSVNFEVRHLKVGDFVWICKDSHGNELVLPYIVERKRMDDLGSSIKDGRFHEQKFRLRQCKLENVIYLVENYGQNNQRLGLPLANLQQACANTQITDGFTVHYTEDHSSSMRYLSFMTNLLTELFRNKTLMSCKKTELPPFDKADDLVSLMTFADFNKGSGKYKKYKVKDMLIKQLIQLKGLSVEKALAIVQCYPTFPDLVSVLRDEGGEKKIAGLKFGTTNRSVGPVIAKTLYQLYTTPVLE